jgi:hypothetical protein
MQNIEELIKLAENQQGLSIGFRRHQNGTYSVRIDGDDSEDLTNATFEMAIAKLKCLAGPKFVAVTLPIAEARRFAAINQNGDAGKIGYCIQVELDRLDLL